MNFVMNFEEELKKRGLMHSFKPSGNLLKSPNIKPPEECSTLEFIAKTPSLGERKPEELGMRTIDGEFNAANIPRRNWIIERYALASYITLFGAEGATGKSMLTLTLAVSVALGKDLLDLGNTVQGGALVINNEDDDDELNRRLAGIFKHHRIKSHEVTDKLYIKSGYGNRVTIATNDGQVLIMSPDVDKIIKEVKRCDIKLLIIDPFVSTHQENENDNSAIDTVMNYYRHIASETGVAIVLVHHTRKSGEESDNHAGDIDVMRGASSLKDAARLCFTLSRMGKKTANEQGVDAKSRNQLSRLDDAKNNFTLSDSETKWLKMESVLIANGEWIGVPRAYDMPDPIIAAKKSPEDQQHKKFQTIANAVIRVLGEDGGSIMRPELLKACIAQSGLEQSQLESYLQELPKGESKSVRLNIGGRFFRIYQVDGTHAKAAKTIYLTLDE